MGAVNVGVAAYLAGIGVVLGLMCVYGSIKNKGRKSPN